MQTHTYLEESLLKIFLLINLNLSKPLRSTLSELIACLLENNKAHISKLGEILSIDGTKALKSFQRLY